MCVCERERHTQDHVYIDLEQSPGAVQYTSPPPSLSQSLAFSFSLIWLKWNCWASRWEGRKSAFKDLPPAVLRHFCRADSRLHTRVWAHSEALAPVPVQTSAPSKTLSDGQLLNSLLLSEKKDIFLPHLHPSPSLPRNCRNKDHLVLSFFSPPSADGAMSLEHFENKKKRGEAERNEGGSVYRNIVTKKENCSWLWNITRKKRVVAFVISFFYLMLLSLFIFEDQYFHGGVLFRRTFSKDAVFVFVL